jgi:flavin-dependent dehydrogenase
MTSFLYVKLWEINYLYEISLSSLKKYLLTKRITLNQKRLVRTIKVDIIGGGLSGLSTAISLKENDAAIEVVVHEKYKEIGYNHDGRRCGEAHTFERDWMKWKPTGKSIYNTILNGKVVIGKKNYRVKRPPNAAFILNRQEFICQLARDAEKRGAVLQTNDKIISADELDSDFIVDASGCPSSIKRDLDLGSGFVGRTFQQTLEKANCFVAHTMKIIFSPILGYFWIFPRNPEKKEVNVGVGTLGDFGYNLRDILESFKKEYQITGTVNYVVGGLIPLGLQRPLIYKNILFVGDAGVGAFPFSGQGIYRALMSGDIAGFCIAKKQSKKYPSSIRRAFLPWDLMGSTFIRMNLVFRKINPELFLTSLNLFSRAGSELSPLTH